MKIKWHEPTSLKDKKTISQYKVLYKKALEILVKKGVYKSYSSANSAIMSKSKMPLPPPPSK